MSDETGLLFDLQGFSFHDGPGSRTVVFLKGCPLRCRWCANPEGQDPNRELMFYREQCEKNYSCISSCPDHALTITGEGLPATIQREHCSLCTDFNCVRACNYRALQVNGFFITVQDLMKKIHRDRHYWGSGGGVTVSGGEPMEQYPFVKKFLSRCFDSYIHTAMETSGHAPWEHFHALLGYLDWVFFDLKCMNDDRHRAGTGISNRLILENAKKMATSWEGRLIFRVPVIPGFNDSRENILATAEFIAETGKNEVNLLPLHHLGMSKYGLLGRAYPCGEVKPPDSTDLRQIEGLFGEYSVECYCGSDTPF
ncbi:MAG: glycyl-radical enzyme activating protein [Methanomicrobiales archaeon]